MAFAAAVLVGVAAASIMARGEGHEHPTSWNVVDLAKLQRPDLQATRLECGGGFGDRCHA